MRLKDTFIQKAPAKEVETATRRQIRAAMHEAAGYEAIFDLIAQHGMHKCPDCNADVEDNESGSTLCKDCRAKPVAKKESQAGGPNMLAPLDAPEALDIDVNDMSDKWPEQDILKQVQDLRTQGMQDGSIFKQLMEMQVLGTPTPLPEDMTYLKSIMKSAQVKDPKRQKELDQIEQFKNKKKVDKPKPPEDDAPADSSAPKPSELNTFDQNVFKQTGPDGKPLMERPKGPKLQLDTIEEMQAVAESFIAMLRKVKDKVKIVIEELLKADHPLPGGVSSDVLEEGQTPAGTPTKSDKSSLRRELAFLQNKLERADGAYMRLIRHPGMDEMLQGIELEFLHKAIAMPLTGDDLGGKNNVALRGGLGDLGSLLPLSAPSEIEGLSTNPELRLASQSAPPPGWRIHKQQHR